MKLSDYSHIHPQGYHMHKGYFENQEECRGFQVGCDHIYQVLLQINEQFYSDSKKINNEVLIIKLSLFQLFFLHQEMGY